MKRGIASDNTDKSVLERQRARVKYQHQLDQTDYGSNFAAFFSDPIDGSMDPHPGWENGWSGFGFESLQVNYRSVADAKETPSNSSETRRSGNIKKGKLETVKVSCFFIFILFYQHVFYRFEARTPLGQINMFCFNIIRRSLKRLKWVLSF